jgi:hypothetical protein
MRAIEETTRRGIGTRAGAERTEAIAAAALDALN